MTRVVVAADRVLAPWPVDPPLLAVEDGVVTALGAAAAPPHGRGSATVRLRGTLTPGLIDLQVNGGAGVSLQVPDPDVARLHAWLRRGGVLAYQPTLVSAPTARMAALCRALAQVGEVDAVVALPPHLEGPFLSVRRLGVHDAGAVETCDAASVLAAAHAGAGMVTLAPERPGAVELLQDLARSGVRVSLGHSDATLAQAEAAFAAGAVMVTHVFNAMAPLHHRAPGLAGAALAGAHTPWVGLIADGVHVAPEMCAMTARLVGERLVLVSDAVELAGGGSTEARDAAGRLAGSALRLDGGLRNLVDWGVDPAAAVHAATLAPARVLGLDDRGSLEAGRLAVGALWDAAWRVVAAGPIAELAPTGAPA